MGKKRSRQSDTEEEPLSKRINNLHLDNKNPSSSSSSGSSPEHINSALNMDQTQSLLGYFGPQMDSINNNIVCKNSDVLHGNSAVLSQIQEEHPHISTYEALQRLTSMIENRELPESLNHIYPSENPTSNAYYYEFNRALHFLHLERLRRQGKI